MTGNLTVVKPQACVFTQNELALINLGKDPEAFDEYIFGALNQI